MTETSGPMASGPRADETTPLLAEPEGARSDGQGDIEDATSDADIARDRLMPLIKRLMILSVTGAVLVLTLAAALSVLISVKPRRFRMPWTVQYSFPATCFSAVVAGISSMIQIRAVRNHPQPRRWIGGFVAILVDAALVFLLVASVGSVIDDASYLSPEGQCFEYGYPDSPEPPRDLSCETFARSFILVVWFYVGAILLLALAHLVTLVIRIALMYKSWSYQGTEVSQWTFPSWDFTIEFAIKFHRQDNGNVASSREQGPVTADL